MSFPAAPHPFLEVRVDDRELSPPLLALCAGFERGVWRRKALARYLFLHLYEFCFRWSELAALESRTGYDMLTEAARRLYASRQFDGRGEFGELLLHAVLRSHFDSTPALSKLFFKTADNDTVKGYDCVHVVEDADRLELWFGEAKLYSSIYAAMRDAAAELERHTTTNYLRREFALIQGKVDGPYAPRIKRLLDPGVSLDDVFDTLRIPVLLTYNSTTVKRHRRVSDDYKAELEREVRRLYALFVDKCVGLPDDVRVHVILVPLRHRGNLVRHLDERLRELQGNDDEEVEEGIDENEADDETPRGADGPTQDSADSDAA
jgi:Cap4 SAVED domain